MKILLTGKPGIGKSTIIKNFLQLYSGKKNGIVITRMLDGNGENQGFKAENLKGETKTIAHRKNVHSDIVIGNGHMVDISAIDTFVVPELLLSDSSDVLTIIDEIGRMQSYSVKFIEAVRKLIKSNNPLLGTIVFDDEPFAREFKSNPQVILVLVTKENKDQLPSILNTMYSHNIEYSSLIPNQKDTCRTLLKNYFDKNMFLQIGKLFNNAIPYIAGGKVEKNNETFTIKGNHGEHIVEKVMVTLRATVTYLMDLENMLGRRENAPIYKPRY